MNNLDDFDGSDYQRAVEDLFRRGELNYRNQNYQAAIENYTRLLQLNPNESKAYSRRSAAWVELGNYQEAIKDYTQCLKLQPNFVKGYVARAGLFKDAGNLQRAIDDCTHAISIGSDWNHIAYRLRGDCYGLLKNYQAAIEDYSQSIRSDPENIEGCYQKRGYCHQQLEHYHEAIEDCTQALRCNSEIIECYQIRAQSHQALGNWEESISDFTEVIRREPAPTEYTFLAYIGRGVAYRFLNDRESAVSDYDAAARLSLDRGDTKGYQKVMMLIESVGITQGSSEKSINDNKLSPVPISHIVAAIFFPPLGVFLTVGLGFHFWINLILTFVFTWIPGVIHALWLVFNHDRS